MSLQSEKKHAINQQRLEEKLEIWVLKGMIDHDYSESDLKLVVEKYKRISMVPNGYNFPELHRKEELSQEMQEMLQRKALHLQQQDWKESIW